MVVKIFNNPQNLHCGRVGYWEEEAEDRVMGAKGLLGVDLWQEEGGNKIGQEEILHQGLTKLWPIPQGGLENISPIKKVPLEQK